MATSAAYDTLGQGYALKRRPDPRIGKQLKWALEGCSGVLNVGAGAGSYENDIGATVSLEPSKEMISQRPQGRVPCVRGRAEALPFRDKSLDACCALLTMHHWSDPATGLAEMMRVAKRRVVVMSWEPGAGKPFWLIRDYLPSIDAIDTERFSNLARLLTTASNSTCSAIKIPSDCMDGFQAAYWKRPQAYLDSSVRRAISTFHLLPEAEVEAGLYALSRDLKSGKWKEKNKDLLSLKEADFGYRLTTIDLSLAAS